MVLIFEIHKDFVNERLCKFTPEIEATRQFELFIYISLGDIEKSKSVFLKRRHCSLKGKVSSLSFLIRQCSIPDLSWITDAAIPLNVPAVEGNDHVVIVYFNSAPTPNSFFIDCFRFEAHSLWKRHNVISQPCVQLLRSKQVCDH